MDESLGPIEAQLLSQKQTVSTHLANHSTDVDQVSFVWVLSFFDATSNSFCFLLQNVKQALKQAETLQTVQLPLMFCCLSEAQTHPLLSRKSRLC
jgi:hypothetical protein